MALNRPSSIPFWCPLCVGNGSVERCDQCDEGAAECSECEGREYTACGTCEGERTSACKHCEGEGWKLCPRCDSHGRVFGLMPWETKASRPGWTDDGMLASLAARTQGEGNE